MARFPWVYKTIQWQRVREAERTQEEEAGEEAGREAVDVGVKLELAGTLEICYGSGVAYAHFGFPQQGPASKPSRKWRFLCWW